MRTTVSVLVVLAATGCGKRFGSLTSGDYECSAEVTTNRCEVALPSSTALVRVQADGDLLGLLVPSSSALTTAPDVPWDSAQFGAQANPLSYYVSGRSACGAGTLEFVSDAQLTELGQDTLRVRVAHRYTGAAACAPVDMCELVFDVRCVRRP